MATKRRHGQGTLYKRGHRGPWRATWYDHTGKRREEVEKVPDFRHVEKPNVYAATCDVVRRGATLCDSHSGVAQLAEQGIHKPLPDSITPDGTDTSGGGDPAVSNIVNNAGENTARGGPRPDPVTDPDLRRVIDRWPTLPAAVRDAIARLADLTGDR